MPKSEFLGQPWFRGILIGLIVASIALLGIFEDVDRWYLNFQYKLRGPIPPQTPLIIISIDEDSFDELDLQWPWPRALHGQLLDIVRQGEPAVVGIDIIFSEPSSRGAQDDRALATALARAGKVVLGAAFTEVKTPSYTKADLNPPIDELLDHAAAFGDVNLAQDKDAYVRTAQLTRVYQGALLPGFDFHVHQLAVRSGIPSAPSAEEQTFLINYRGGPQTFPTVPFYQVLNGEIKPEVFRGKIVLVGATTPILHDMFPTPFTTHGGMPGVEIHANVLETLFQGIPLKRAPRSLNFIGILLAGMLAVWLANRCRPLMAFGLITVVALGYAGIVYMSFVRGRLLLEISGVPFALALGYGATAVENFIQEQRKRASLMQLFSKHVAPEVASAIWEHRDQILKEGRLLPQKMIVTVLFTDLKGFTPITEKLDTSAMLDWLNDYMEIMAQLVMDYGGVVDDYAGDSIKANFGVPIPRASEDEIARDAVNAVECALAMEKGLLQLNTRLQEQHLPPVSTRIGIFTGPVVAGSLGAKQRLKYTTIGDTVNTASRLESFQKDLSDPYLAKSSCRILIGEPTFNYLGDQFKAQRLGEISVKGKEKKLVVYRVLSRKDAPEPLASLREEVRVTVQCMVSISDEEITVQAPTSDLSAGGLSVYNLTVQFEKDRIVQMRLALSTEAPPIDVNAKLSWSVADKAGFAFLDLKPDGKAAIEKFLAERVAPH